MNAKRLAANRTNRLLPTWDDEDVATLRTLFAEKKTYSAIGAVLGCSRSAVAGKCRRLGLYMTAKERHQRFVEQGRKNNAAHRARHQGHHDPL